MDSPLKLNINLKNYFFTSPLFLHMSLKKRRRRKYRRKYVLDEVVKRSKKLLPYQVNDLLLTLDVYVTLLEDPIFELLEELMVPKELWEFYIGFAKRVLMLKLKYEGSILEREIESLMNEYVLRGLDKEKLSLIESKVEDIAPLAKEMITLTLSAISLELGKTEIEFKAYVMKV